MILHVTFSDGSNPWVSYPANAKQAAQQWRRWIKNNPDTAAPTVFNGDYMLQQAEDGSPSYWVWERHNFFKTQRKYKTLGHALRALDRLGGAAR